MKMAKPSDHPGFATLLEEWNKKLEDSGFRDVEYKHHNDISLKKTGSERRYENMDEITRDARVQYFDLVTKYVAKAQFDSELDKKILTLHAQGVSQRDIQAVLGIKGHRCKVYRPLYKWLRRWGLK